MLGRVHAELKVPHVRLSKDGLNVRDPRIAEQLHSQLRDANKKHLWVSLPCTSGCPWHRIGLALHGASYRKKHAKEVAESRALFKQFTQHAKTALKTDMMSRSSGLVIPIPGSATTCKSSSKTPASRL